MSAIPPKADIAIYSITSSARACWISVGEQTHPVLLWTRDATVSASDKEMSYALRINDQRTCTLGTEAADESKVWINESHPLLETRVSEGVSLELCPRLGAVF